MIEVASVCVEYDVGLADEYDPSPLACFLWSIACELVHYSVLY